METVHNPQNRYHCPHSACRFSELQDYIGWTRQDALKTHLKREHSGQASQQQPVGIIGNLRRQIQEKDQQLNDMAKQHEIELNAERAARQMAEAEAEDLRKQLDSMK